MNFDKYQKNGAYHFDWYDDPNFVWYKECVDHIVNFCHGSTIDLGGGDGLVAYKIMERSGFSCIVLDNDETGLKLAMQRGIPAAKFDIEHDVLRYTAEYLCCLNTIEHLTDPQELLEIFKYNIEKAGIIITDKATEHPGRYHEHEYTKKELLETFKEFNPKYFEINSTEHGKPITFIGVEITR